MTMMSPATAAGVHPHGISSEAVEVGKCVTRRHVGSGEVVDGGRLWAWRAEWSPRVTVVRCDRCGLSFAGDVGPDFYASKKP